MGVRYDTGLIEELIVWLQSNLIGDQSIQLLHNDFKLDNLLLNSDTLEPVALVDWDQGTRGDGLFDLATFLSYWTQADDPQELKAMRQMPTDQPGFPTRRQVADMYAQTTGRDLSDFRFYRVLALLKTAIIFFQLHLRYRNGKTDDPRYAEFADVADALLECAHAVQTNRIF